MPPWTKRPSKSWRHLLVLMLLGFSVGGGLQGQEDDDDKDDNGRRGVQDFSLSVSPSTGSVVQGSSRTYTVELSSIDSDGIDDEISLTISGLRTGLTETFSGSLSSTSTSTTLTVTAEDDAAVATSNFTVTGTADSGLTRRASASVTVTARQPTSFSITPGTVRLDEPYTISAGNAASMTLDLRYRKDGGSTQTITGWPTLGSNGRASATPTLESQVGSYVFTGYRNTQASTWLPSNVRLRVLPALNPDFDLTVSPDSKKVYRGASGTYTVRLDSIDGFSFPVALSVSGLPTGVDHPFTSTSVTPTGTTTLTIDVGSSVSPGRYRFTVTGRGGGKTHTDTAEVVVPHFTVSMTPETEYVNRGSSQTYTVEVQPQNGFARNVQLSVSGLGTGLSGSFSRTTVTSSNWTSVLTIATSCSTTASRDEFTVTGRGGGYTASGMAAVTPRTFSVLVTPESANLQRGSRVEYEVEVDKQPGFSGNVRLSVSSLPSGVTGRFSPNPTHSTSTLTLSARPNADLGRDEFTVTGTAHGCTATDTDDVVVTDPTPDPEFEVLMSPERGDVDRGSSRTYDVEVDPEPGFTSNVTLRVSNLGPGLTGSFDSDRVTSSDWTSRLTVASSCEAALGSDNFTVTGAGGGASDSDTDTVVVRGFSLSGPSETVSLAAGSSAGVTITVHRDSGFASNVALSVSDLPEGVSGSFSPTSTGSSSRLTLRVDPGAPAVSTTFTVTGTAHGCPESITVPIEITRPGFQVALTPESADLRQGASVDYTLTVTPGQDFTSDVTLSVSGLGPGLSWSFSPSPVTSSDWTSRLTVASSCEAALGSDNFTVTGAGGGASDSDTDTVVVRGFSLSGPSETVSLAAGSSAGVTITVHRDSGFASNVALSISDLPEGVSGSFSPTSTGSSSRLTLRVDPGAPAVSTTFTVTGTAHGCPESITVPIEITRPGFQVALTPESADLRQGASVDYTLTVTPGQDFTSDVTLSVSGLPMGVTGEFLSNPVNAASVPAWTSTLQLRAASDVTVGPADFTVTGTSGGQSASDTAMVDITAAPPICALTLDPDRASVAPGASQIYTVRFGLNTVIGTSAEFALGVSGLPSGVTGVLSRESVSTANSTADLTVTVGDSAPFGVHMFTVTGTGPGTPCTVNGILEVTGTGFSLASDLEVGNVDPGGSETYTVTVTGGTGFSSAVTLGVADLGPDFTPTFVPPAVTPTAGNPNPTSVLTLTASATVAPGRDEFSITATRGELVRSIPAAIVVNAPPGFTVSVNPGSINLNPDTSGTYTVTVSRQGEFSSEVSLSTSDLGTDFTPAFSPPSVTPTAETPRPTSVLTLTASDTVSPVTDPFTITGTSGEISAATAATVVVPDDSGDPDFTLSVEPNDGGSNGLVHVPQGGSGSFTVEVTRSGGFTGTVDLTVSGQREGMTADFSDASLSSSETTSELIVEADEDFSGNALIYLTVQARSDTLNHTKREAEVVLIQGFHLQATPPASREIARGQSLAYTLNLPRLFLFDHRIHLSVEGLEADSDLTPSFSDAELQNSESTSVLTLTAGPNAPARADEFTIVATAATTASGQTITRSFTSDVTVTGGDFRVEMESSSANAGQGSFATYRVMVPRTDGFMVEVQLSVSGLGTGLTGVFYETEAPSETPTNSTPTYTLPFDDDDVQLKIAASTGAAAGNHEFTITGTGGGLTRTTQSTVDVVIRGGGDIGVGTGATFSGPHAAIIVTLTGQNWKRAVDGVINVECGQGSEGHSAPCGNWGVSSNYSTVLEDTDQFRGWKDERSRFDIDLQGPTTKLHWNSCTTKKAKYHAPNCEIYNDPPQGSMGECMRQKTRDFDDEAKSTVTHGSLSYRYDARACPDPATLGTEQWTGCETLVGITVGQFSNHMTLYELDRAFIPGSIPVISTVLNPILGLITDHDLIRTLYFPGTTVMFEEGDCSYNSCVEKTTPWKPRTGYGHDGELHAIIDAQLRMKARAELQGTCDWESGQ